MNTWKPISTVTKDTLVLVTRIPFTNRPPVAVARFCSNKLAKHKYPWRVSGGERLKWGPTHWCEIPAIPSIPPEEQQANQILELAQNGPVTLKDGTPRLMTQAEHDSLKQEIEALRPGLHLDFLKSQSIHLPNVPEAQK